MLEIGLLTGSQAHDEISASNYSRSEVDLSDFEQVLYNQITNKEEIDFDIITLDNSKIVSHVGLFYNGSLKIADPLDPHLRLGEGRYYIYFDPGHLHFGFKVIKDKDGDFIFGRPL